MHKFRIRLAETVICAEIKNEYCINACKDYLTEEDPEIFVSVSEEDLIKERAFAANAETPERLLEWVALYRKICTELAFKNTVLIHGSCIAVDGNAYLFCAPSGTGKSTHTKLWRQYIGERAVMINDDKPLVRVEDDKTVRIYGTPWCGKHNLGTNTFALLKTVCFLERGEKNIIERFPQIEAFPRLMKFVFRPEDREAMMQVMDTASGIVDNTDFWKLKCNMEMKAAEVAFEEMSK